MPSQYRKRQNQLIEALKAKLPNIAHYEPAPEDVNPQSFYKDVEPLINGKFRLTIKFYFNKGTRSDIDNMIGGLLDTFNKIIWVDDSLCKGFSKVEVIEQAGFNRIQFKVDLINE